MATNTAADGVESGHMTAARAVEVSGMKMIKAAWFGAVLVVVGDDCSSPGARPDAGLSADNGRSCMCFSCLRHGHSPLAYPYY